ncbi:MAG: class I SAM-dependent methyltransferase [Dehalococcoidales bacterium]|nr:class I SAM-dependent methyltransferase [Dehalococcoidales bacterium]
MTNEEKYYLRYDDRYRRMHSQGFERWVSSPEQNAGVMVSINTFLKWAGCKPGTCSIIEFGCGEGILAENLLSNGYDYLGLDISGSALEKARKHAGEQGRNAFMLADVLTGLDSIPDNSRDIGIDNQCLHMLVTDEHRWNYLSNIRRIIKPGGMVFFRENIQEEEFTGSIRDFTDWLAKTGNEYSTLHDYSAYKDDEQHTVRLPRVPARFNNEAGYRRELEDAGFSVEHFEPDDWLCIMHTAVRK